MNFVLYVNGQMGSSEVASSQPITFKLSKISLTANYPHESSLTNEIETATSVYRHTCPNKLAMNYKYHKTFVYLYKKLS